jgi:hypothetical protein
MRVHSGAHQTRAADEEWSRLARRCDRPMFDVSNIIAYGGDLMVYGTRHEGDFPGENCWIDVRSGQSEGTGCRPKAPRWPACSTN